MFLSYTKAVCFELVIHTIVELIPIVMRYIKFLTYTPLLLLFLLLSCDREEVKPDDDPADDRLPQETLVLNYWIRDGMAEVYLWEEFLPDLDPEEQADPEAYFYNLLYASDRFSFINDDYDAVVGDLDGEVLSTGISAQPVLISETDVVAYIEYVEPDSPAGEAGIKRGEIILGINGESFTRDNYFSLTAKNTQTLRMGTFNGFDFVPTGAEHELTARQIFENPVHHVEIIEYAGKRIGYMAYNSFSFGENNQFLDSLNQALTMIKEAGVDDVLIDLRYNRGGYGYVSNYFAGALAPLSVSQSQEVFQRQEWNDFYMDFWTKYDANDDGIPDGSESSQLVERFEVTDVNLDLSRVFFLTTGSTASASESLMIGLYPYMDVTQIGSTTSGKCYGAWPLGDWEDPPRHNWIMVPVVLKYANADGFTDFLNGINPDVEIIEDWTALKPFGSLEDPLIEGALAEITDTQAAARKSTSVLPSYRLLDDPGSTRLLDLDPKILREAVPE